MSVEFSNKKIWGLWFVCLLFPLLYFSINSFLLNFVKLLVHDRLKTLKTSFEMVRSIVMAESPGFEIET